jgi:hypothetical protein
LVILTKVLAIIMIRGRRREVIKLDTDTKSTLRLDRLRMVKHTLRGVLIYVLRSKKLCRRGRDGPVHRAK